MRLLLFCLLLLTTSAHAFESAASGKPTDSLNEARLHRAIHTLQAWYDTTTGIWNTTSWWNAANAITTLSRYTRLTGDTRYLPIIEHTFKKTRHFPVPASKDRPAWVCHHYLNDYFDDAGWWGLAWLDVYAYTHDTAYLNTAQIIFEDMITGWDTVCGGGTYWKKPNISKGAISNGLLLNLALKLWEHAPEGSTYPPGQTHLQEM